MSGKFTRVSLAEAGNGQTDWKRLRALRESELEAAIAADPDCLALSPHVVSRTEARILRHVARAELKPWARTRPLRRSELRKLSI
jgi:hypothetical protein